MGRRLGLRNLRDAGLTVQAD